LMVMAQDNKLFRQQIGYCSPTSGICYSVADHNQLLDEQASPYKEALFTRSLLVVENKDLLFIREVLSSSLP
jgi:hypothetical protein